ncbi:MAG: hypothetical protein AAF367_15145 [Pseudomonadota bacterium]
MKLIRPLILVLAVVSLAACQNPGMSKNLKAAQPGWKNLGLDRQGGG